MKAGRGAALAELMVALAVGLLVSLFAGVLLVGANKSFVVQGDAADMDDSGRFAIDALSRALRQAAWIDWDSRVALRDALPAAIAGLDARSLARELPALDDPRPAEANGSDVLALRFDAAGMVNCAGFEEADGWSIFYVARAADGEAELRCKYHGEHGWTSDAIVHGVDSFHVLYGIDVDGDGMPERYLNASAIDALDAALGLVGATAQARMRDFNRKTWWKRVVSVKVALLLHGGRAARQDDTPLVFDLFGPDYTEPGTHIDERRLPPEQRRRLRRLFTTSVTLRNASR